MADEEDPAQAAQRLEAALERIAKLTRRPQSVPSGTDTAHIATRVDALIAQLRAALGTTTGS